ncbi:MAG: hypothetical protein IJS47_02595 [Clostridia bacterium]|nr:hypothetical protein [Clostridia bacterium]
MKSKKSFFNKTLILNNLSGFWWCSALCTLLIFLIVPFRILNIDLRYYSKTYSMMSDYYATVAIYFAYAVAVAALIFRYLQTSKAVTLMHSMPFTRLGLYINHWISGFIIIMIPLVINLSILFLIQGFTKFNSILLISSIWKWFLLSTMISVTLYSIAVMVGTFTGSSIAQIVFTYILNVLPVGLYALAYMLLQGLVYGLKINDWYGTSLLKLMPITQNLEESLWYLKDYKSIIIINIVLLILSIVIGYFVYKARKLERAGDVISNGVLRPIFKYGVTVCVMAVGVTYIKYIINGLPNILIYVLFALLGYAIAQMLLIKSLKIQKYYKGFLGFLAVLFVAALVVKFDLTGFERRVPNVEDVDAVVIGYYSNIKDVNFDTLKSKSGGAVLADKDNIKSVVDIHKYLIKNRPQDELYWNYSIAYKLKNGKIIERDYPISEEKYEEYFRDIYKSKEYKLQRSGLFLYDEADLGNVQIRNKNEDVVKLTYDQGKEFLKLAKSRVLESDYELKENVVGPYLYELEFEFEIDIKKDESLKPYTYMDSTMATKSYCPVTFYVKREDTELVNAIRNFIEPITLDNIQYLRLSKETQVSNHVIEHESIREIRDKDEMKDIISKIEYDNTKDLEEYYGVYAMSYRGYESYLGEILTL